MSHCTARKRFHRVQQRCFPFFFFAREIADESRSFRDTHFAAALLRSIFNEQQVCTHIHIFYHSFIALLTRSVQYIDREKCLIRCKKCSFERGNLISQHFTNGYWFCGVIRISDSESLIVSHVQKSVAGEIIAACSHSLSPLCLLWINVAFLEFLANFMRAQIFVKPFVNVII